MNTYKLITEKNQEIEAECEDYYPVGFWVLVGLQKENLFAKIIEEIGNDSTKKMPNEIIRKAKRNEIDEIEKNIERIKRIKQECQKAADNLDLPMRILEVIEIEHNNQLRIAFISSSRIDFRELAKKLAAKYKKRIEFRQIGARDKAKMVGGLGPCGLILCCNNHLVNFETISINMAKNQMLSLTPQKINGQCGRLLCCLNYENENYTKLKQKLPRLGSFVKTKQGSGKVVELRIIKGTFLIELDNKERIEIDSEQNYKVK